MAASTLGVESLLSPLKLSSFSIPPPIAAAPKLALPLRPSPLPPKLLSSPIPSRRASPQFSVRASSTPSTAKGRKIRSVPTKPVEGQKTGTSGLRKKVKVFQQKNYLANWIQSLFNSLPPEDYKGSLLVLGGDGRYFNREAAQIIVKIAAGNGVGKILVGKDGLMSTPAVSAVIRKRKANGGFIMSASHNPGGPEYDWGIKFNYSSGQPAPESITDKIYGNTLSISEIKIADIPDIDLSCLGVTNYGDFSVEVIDPVSDYLELMEYAFDFQLIRGLLSRPDFSQPAFEFLVERTLLCPYLGILMKKDIFMPIKFLMHLASELFPVSFLGVTKKAPCLNLLRALLNLPSIRSRCSASTTTP